MTPERPTDGRRSAALRGIAFMVLAALCNTGFTACARHVSATIHPFEVVAFRTAIGLLLLAPFLARRGLAGLRTERLWMHGLRGAVVVGSTLAYFAGLALVPLEKLTAINFSGPLFATLLAIWVLGERADPRRLVALAVGYAGTLIVLRPGLIAVDFGSILILIASAGYGASMILVKLLSRRDSSLTITVYTFLLVFPVAALLALPVWRTPDLTELAWLVAVGVLGAIQQMAMAQAFKEAEATVVLPFDFTRLLWASVIGQLLFGDPADLWTWVGGATIFAAVLALARAERVRGRA